MQTSLVRRRQLQEMDYWLPLNMQTSLVRRRQLQVTELLAAAKYAD